MGKMFSIMIPTTRADRLELPALAYPTSSRTRAKKDNSKYIHSKSNFGVIASLSTDYDVRDRM